MSKVKAPTLAERVAKLEEATGLRTTTAPPPEKPECLFYGKAAMAKSFLAMYETEAAVNVGLRAALADKTARLTGATADMVSKDLVIADLRRQRDALRADAEAAKLKAGNCVAVPSPNMGYDGLWPSLVCYSGLAGLALGALVGGLLL